MVPAETGSESAAVVNAAAVSVNNIFMGIISIDGPSPLTQRLRESRVASQQRLSSLFQLSVVLENGGQNAADSVS